MSSSPTLPISPLPDNLDRVQQLRAFDDTKAGVKGLTDSGIQKLPKIFVRPPEELPQQLTSDAQIQVQIPVIDLTGIHEADGRKQVIEQVRTASNIWGFFQVVNHGVPSSVLDAMINGIREFHEMDVEEKKKYYTRDPSSRVRYNSNFDLFTSKAADWRDTLGISFHDGFQPEQLPLPCRESTLGFSKHVGMLGETLLELLSEALELNPNHLNQIECSKGHWISCHYYPACPEPELAIGATKHSDIGFLTVLLQNHISGLQVLHHDRWITVEPNPQALVVNIGDLLQLVSNGKFISNKHRVISSRYGPRISAALFFSGPIHANNVYGPIKELTSDENPAIYKEVQLRDYLMKFVSCGLDKYAGLKLWIYGLQIGDCRCSQSSWDCKDLGDCSLVGWRHDHDIVQGTCSEKHWAHTFSYRRKQISCP